MITITDHKFMIENYVSILYLSEQKIIIQMSRQQIIITGNHFQLEYYSSIEIRGIGNIAEVRFVS